MKWRGHMRSLIRKVLHHTNSRCPSNGEDTEFSTMKSSNPTSHLPSQNKQKESYPLNPTLWTENLSTKSPRFSEKRRLEKPHTSSFTGKDTELKKIAGNLRST